MKGGTASDRRVCVDAGRKLTPPHGRSPLQPSSGLDSPAGERLLLRPPPGGLSAEEYADDQELDELYVVVIHRRDRAVLFGNDLLLMVPEAINGFPDLVIVRGVICLTDDVAVISKRVVKRHASSVFELQPRSDHGIVNRPSLARHGGHRL